MRRSIPASGGVGRSARGAQPTRPSRWYRRVDHPVTAPASTQDGLMVINARRTAERERRQVEHGPCVRPSGMSAGRSPARAPGHWPHRVPSRPRRKPASGYGIMRPDGTFTRTSHFAPNQTYSGRAAMEHHKSFEREETCIASFGTLAETPLDRECVWEAIAAAGTTRRGWVKLMDPVRWTCTVDAFRQMVRWVAEGRVNEGRAVRWCSASRTGRTSAPRSPAARERGEGPWASRSATTDSPKTPKPRV